MRCAVMLAAVLLAGCVDRAPVAIPVPPAAPVSAGMQYLYGSGEAAALSIQAYHALILFAQSEVAKRPADSIVLAADATLDAPSFVPCGDKPLAAVFDVDETMIGNLGYEWHEAMSGKGYDPAAWDRWEKTGADKVAAIPGAVFAVNALRRMGVIVVFNSNRAAENAAGATEAIHRAGLGAAVHGETLFLAGDDASGSHKDGRRATIAAKYCVIAMGGDQLGDFSDLFNRRGLSIHDRRMAASSGAVARLWGNGWFILPNPVYGPALQGSLDDIFPLDKRWADPPEEKK